MAKTGENGEYVSSFETFLHRYISPHRTWFFGLWLLLLYIVCGTLVVLSLTAHQVHHKIHKLKVNDQAITIAQVYKFSDDLERLNQTKPQKSRLLAELTDQKEIREKEKATLNIHLVRELNKLTPLKTKLIEVQNRLDTTQLADTERNALTTETDELGEQIAKQKELISPIEEKYNDADDNLFETECKIAKERQRLLEAESLWNAEKNELIKDYHFERKTLTNQGNQTSIITTVFPDGCRGQREINKNKPLLLHGEITEIQQDVKFLSKFKKDNKSDRENSLFNLFNYLKFWEMFPFIDMPNELLTQMVVLSMGAVGGTIALTRTYLLPKSEKEDVPWSRYFYTPFLGAITAFSVYVLSKAGVLVFADTGSSTDGARLSPFFISFLGIISGMLAEPALDTISRVGEGWFRQAEAGVSRYGIGLDKKLTPEDITEIALLLGINQKIVEDWVQEKTRVPPKYQDYIAARLQAPQGQLFSDLKPGLVKPKTQPAAVADAGKKKDSKPVIPKPKKL